MDRNIGLKWESSKDSDKDSNNEKTNWAISFTLLKNRGFSHNEILNLSYPQFLGYMSCINNPITYPIAIPYMGSSKEEEKVEENNEITSKEGLANLMFEMNKGF